MSLGEQILWLLILAIPIACVTRTFVFEEIFREPREFLRRLSESHPRWFVRKCCYVFTCEYCFSHYVTIVFLVLTRYRLLLDDWRGYVISFFALVLVANAYLNLYGRLRLDIHREKAEIKSIEEKNGAPKP